MEILRHIPRRKLALRTALGLVCLLTLAVPLCRAADAPLEYQVKAAFLLNFAKFIEWPVSAFASKDSAFAICILGDDPFAGALEQTVEEESIGGRRIAIRRIRRAPDPQACQIVYVGKAEKNFSAAEFGFGVLTVGERDGFLARGGIIAFVIEERKVRFDISSSAAARASLKPSSKLLRVARVIEK